MKENKPNANHQNLNNSQRGQKQNKESKRMLLALLVIALVSLFGLGFYFWGPTLPITYMVETEDNIELATDVYLPRKPGTYPVLLFRTPYGKSEAFATAQPYVKLGIGFISQDHRGCHASGGEYTAFASDGIDALNTVKWMKQQPWFNGKYATIGASARGITQYMQVPYLDDVACQFIQIATPDVYGQGLFQGGAPRKMLAENWLSGIDQDEYYQTIFDHPLSNSTFAADHRIDDYEWNNVTWPSIHRGGWYDCFNQGILDGYMGYQHKGGKEGAGHAKLIMGPWTHALNSRNAGELTYPENAESDPYSNDIFEAMFAEKLLDITEFGDYRTFPNVTYYMMGDIDESSNEWNNWAEASDWPLPYTNKTLYFHENNTLQNVVPTSTSEKSFLYDPADPVDTLGGANLMSDNRGPFDQRPVEQNREDIVSFTYEITEPLLITGRIWGHLYITSNCTDTDFTVKLCDIYPDGREMLISDGIIRMRHRRGQDKAELMDGSKSTVYEAYVDLWSTAYVFNEGHQLKISVSSSNYPRFAPNLNTGEAIKYYDTDNTYNIANNSIVLSPTYNSSLILPIPDNSPNFI